MYCQNIALKAMQRLSNTIISQSLNVQKKIIRSCTTSVDNLTEWSRLKSKYSQSQQSLMLDVLKKCNMKEMKKYGISEVCIKSLKSSSDGVQFNSLDDFISFDLLEVNELDNICSAIASKKVTKKASIVTPALKKSTIQNLNSAVGLRIGTNFISWSHLTMTGSNCEVSDLHCESISDWPLNASPIETVQAAMKIANAIPDADAYVMEKENSRQSAKLNASFVKFMLRQQQILSVILAVLMTKKNSTVSSDDEIPDFFYTMKPLTTAKNFKLFFGQETVSTNEVIQALFQQKNLGLTNISCLMVNNEMEKYHYSLDHFSKEELNKCLLVTLTFFDLGVLNLSQ